MSLYGLPFPPTFMKFLDYPSQTQDNKQIKLQKTKGNDKNKCIHIVLKTMKTTFKINRLWKHFVSARSGHDVHELDIADGYG